MPHVDADYGVGQGPARFWLALVGGIVVPLVFAALAIKVSATLGLISLVSIACGINSVRPKTSSDFSEPERIHNVPNSPSDNGWAIGSLIATVVLVAIIYHLYL